MSASGYIKFEDFSQCADFTLVNHFYTDAKQTGNECFFLFCFLPMASTSSKHFMKGELSVEILLYNVQPFSFPLFSLQLLKQKTIRYKFCYVMELLFKLAIKVD